MNGGSPQAVPQELFDLALAKKADNDKEQQQAYDSIPKEYHSFIVLLEQNVKLTDNKYFIPADFEKLGAYQNEKGIYLKIKKPYMTVDGRIRMARDEHKEAKAKLNISPPRLIDVGQRLCMEVTVESELYGHATGCIEVNLRGFGVDKSNPVANAQTSAIGRALGFLGYGIIGTAASASLDEMTNIYNSLFATPSNDQFDPKKPIQLRMMVISEINYQGNYAFVEVQLEDKSIAQMRLGQSLFHYESIIRPENVIKVLGWWNGDLFSAVPEQEIIQDQKKNKNVS